MISLDHLAAVAHVQPPCSEEDLAAAEGALAVCLPKTYVALLRLSNGLVALNDRVVLYPVQELRERDQTYEVQRYAPGYLMIGDDSGGRAILIYTAGKPEGVFIVGTGSMSLDDAERLAPSLDAWVGHGLPYRAKG